MSSTGVVLAFHWSPANRRESIFEHGLCRNAEAVTNAEPAQHVSLAPSPSIAWALSGQSLPDARDWDLWQAYVPANTELADNGEYRVAGPIEAWFVATRAAELAGPTERQSA